MKRVKQWLFCVLVIVLTACCVPSTAQAASKKATYKTITSEWKKIQGDYYKKSGGKILYKTSKNSAVHEVFWGEMTACYTNGYYIYLYYLDGAGAHEIIRLRRTTQVERSETGDFFVREDEQDKVYAGLISYDGGYTPWVRLQGNKTSFLGRKGNTLWMLVGVPVEYGQKNYVYCFNMKTGKCKKIRFKMSTSYGFITVTKKYLYGTTEAQGLPQQIAVIDRNSGKSWKVKRKVVSCKFRDGKIYGIEEKVSKDGRTRYYREVTMNGSGKKVLKVGSWSTNYPW